VATTRCEGAARQVSDAASNLIIMALLVAMAKVRSPHVGRGRGRAWGREKN